MHRPSRSRAMLLAALLSLVAIGANAAERVYKWVDADGGVHFGQQPPVATEAQAIRVQKGFSATDPDAPAELSDEEKKAAAQAETCRIATENFQTLSTDGETQRTDEYGETHVLTPEEKTNERARAEAAMQRFCSPQPPAQ